MTHVRRRRDRDTGYPGVPRCWRCRRLTADIPDAACPACRRVIHGCYAAMRGRRDAIPWPAFLAAVAALAAMFGGRR